MYNHVKITCMHGDNATSYVQVHIDFSDAVSEDFKESIPQPVSNRETVAALFI